MIQQIAKDNGVSIGGELFADSIGDENSDGPTYYDMLKHNTDTIVKALTAQGNSNTKIDNDKGFSIYLAYLGIGLLMIGILFFMIKKMNS